jgi:3-deoxy-7-phosphoheptulonate synthase
VDLFVDPGVAYLTDDLRILALKELSSPEEVRQEFPLSEAAAKTTVTARGTIQNILGGTDPRVLVVAGPCSIHDPKAAIEYAERLTTIASELDDALFFVMRVYFEKPRTTVGWKGLINDPMLDGSFQINKGLRAARKLLLDINELGLPAATEYLDLITPQYVADVVSWGAIGARTTESQSHRELASGLSCPVGFKNGTDGSVSIAIDAIRASTQPHHFLSVTKQGRSAIFSTSGNPDCHIILRGGKEPNYGRAHIEKAAEELRKAGLKDRLMVDCSHSNSQKQHERQRDVAQDLGSQIQQGNPHIMGIMLESHIVGGRQNADNLSQLRYGQSITDACLGWEDSVEVFRDFASAVRKRTSR